MMRLAYWLLARWNRAWCALFGCVACDVKWFPAAAPRDKQMISVAVHCTRCWREYTTDQKRQAIAVFKEREAARG